MVPRPCVSTAKAAEDACLRCHNKHDAAGKHVSRYTGTSGRQYTGHFPVPQQWRQSGDYHTLLDSMDMLNSQIIDMKRNLRL